MPAAKKKAPTNEELIALAVQQSKVLNSNSNVVPINPNSDNSTAQPQTAQSHSDFKASNYYSTDLGVPNPAFKGVDEATYQQRLELFEAQIREQKLIQKDFEHRREAAKSEELSVDWLNQLTMVDIKRERGNQLGVRLDIEKTQTLIQQEKWKGKQIELAGEQDLNKHNKRLWELKLDNLSDGVKQAELMLKTRREALRSQFSEYQSEDTVISLPEYKAQA
jgi:hypothetical protein